MDNIDFSVPFPTPSEEEIHLMAWGLVRAKRDSLITESDWTQMSDSPLTAEQKSEFVEYRKTLRDLPQSTTNPDDIVWPLKPE